VQDLRNRRQSVNSQLTIEYGKTAEVNPKLIHQMRVKSEQLERDLKIAVARLNAANPTYAELASPEPINIVAVRRLLRKAEALISFWVLNDRLLIWLIRPDEGLIYNDFQIDRATLLKVVKRVRTSLDQSDNLGFANVKPAAFDVSGANLLYRSLFGSLEAHLQGVKHLIIVPDEILLPLPFGALLTNNKDDSFKKSVDLFKKNARLSPQELANYRQLPWLISQYAITVLPSASSLRALREIVDRSVKQGETEPFIGFGDPLLEGDDGLRGGAMIDTRGSAFSLRDIRKLSRLPGTRTELIAIATTLGADPKRALYLSDRATEPMIRKLNDSRVLAKSRVIAFATHGLLAGQLTGLKQPALVLTPPKNLSEHDNGLLELDEILALKLDRAEWAILSACNTGATDGSGDGLAGLVRAFLFSGAKSLLVSHWNVDDSATQALMAEVFRQYTNEKNVSRAEALRQGMLAVMNNTRDNKPYFAHPFAWAPFFLVGEGSASRN
jgi:CHAT domain-containing protein